jgi:sugar lactone lactonase YvrE
MTEAECVLRRDCLLGEGPCWDWRSGRLYWVDIKGRAIEFLCPRTGIHRRFAVDVEPSGLAMRADGTLVVACSRGCGLFEPGNGTLHSKWIIEKGRAQNRCNDAKADSMGRFWVGTMHDGETENTGALYCIDSDRSVRLALDNIGIANTLAWSPDDTTFYFADSRIQTIFAFDFESKTARLSNRRIFATTVGQAMTPDGSAIDRNGYLWNAQWGGARVVRYAPDGRIDRIICLPVSQPTSCAFGGSDLSTLYITSARAGLNAKQLACEPLAGSIFAVNAGTSGLPVADYAG